MDISCDVRNRTDGNGGDSYKIVLLGRKNPSSGKWKT